MRNTNAHYHEHAAHHQGFEVHTPLASMTLWPMPAAGNLKVLLASSVVVGLTDTDTHRACVGGRCNQALVRPRVLARAPLPSFLFRFRRILLGRR
jgi:hypothetical protein